MKDMLLSKRLLRVLCYILGQICEKQLSGLNNYSDKSNSENILPKLSYANNKMLSSLRRKGEEHKNNLNSSHTSTKR